MAYRSLNYVLFLGLLFTHPSYSTIQLDAQMRLGLRAVQPQINLIKSHKLLNKNSLLFSEGNTEYRKHGDSTFHTHSIGIGHQWINLKNRLQRFTSYESKGKWGTYAYYDYFDKNPHHLLTLGATWSQPPLHCYLSHLFPIPWEGLSCSTEMICLFNTSQKTSILINVYRSKNEQIPPGGSFITLKGGGFGVRYTLNSYFTVEIKRIYNAHRRKWMSNANIQINYSFSNTQRAFSHQMNTDKRYTPIERFFYKTF